jgi:hypothetical protein
MNDNSIYKQRFRQKKDIECSKGYQLKGSQAIFDFITSE